MTITLDPFWLGYALGVATGVGAVFAAAWWAAGRRAG